MCYMGFCGAQWLRIYNAGEPGSIPGLRRSPGGGHGNPFQYSCPENPHGQRSLAGYSSQGRTELDTIELVHMLSSIAFWVEDAVHYSRAVSRSSSEGDASLGPNLYVMPHSRNVDVKLSHYNIWLLNVLFIRIIWESE